MNYISEHFEIVDLYNLNPDTIYNVETDPLQIDRLFWDGLAAQLLEEENVPDNDR